MTILAPTPNRKQPAGPLLTPFDVLDIAEAIRNAVAYNATSLDVRDRQALALLTYAPGLRGITRMLASKLANGTTLLPLPEALAMHLLDVNDDADLLPEPDWDVQEAWLAARESATPPCRHDDVRADLADVPHSITVEPVTHEMRRGADLPAAATLVVVERHVGRLAKVCDSTDMHVADYVEWGYNITLADVARGIADTYGATYVEAPAVTA